jgi:hypothetical protein
MLMLDLLAATMIASPSTWLSDAKGAPMQGSDDSAVLTVELRVDRQRATLSYAVRNRTNAEIFLFNRMYDGVDDQGRYRVDKDICNIEVIADRVVISKKIPVLPPNKFVEVRNIPCVIALAGQGEFAESVELRLPLRPWTPYADTPGQTRRVSMPAFVERGYFVGRTGTRALARTVATTAGPGLRFSPFGESSQKILRIGPLASVDVLAAAAP